VGTTALVVISLYIIFKRDGTCTKVCVIVASVCASSSVEQVMLFVKRLTGTRSQEMQYRMCKIRCEVYTVPSERIWVWKSTGGSKVGAFAAVRDWLT
jgi:hypothetical protein